MKHAIWMAVLASMLVVGALPAVASGQAEEEGLTAEKVEQEKMEMDLDARRAELEHEKAMGELEVEARRLEIDRERGHLPGRDGGGVVLLWILVVHILLTVWVCKDMREQNISRALWVPIVLLGGFLGAILYAIVRNADTRAKPAGRARG